MTFAAVIVTFSAPSAAASRCELTNSSSIITTQHIQDIRPLGLHSTTGCFQTSVGKVSGDISTSSMKCCKHFYLSLRRRECWRFCELWAQTLTICLLLEFWLRKWGVGGKPLMSRLSLPAQRWKSLIEQINKAIWLRCCQQLDLSDADRSIFLSLKLPCISFSFWLSFSLRSRELLFYFQKLHILLKID